MTIEIGLDDEGDQAFEFSVKADRGNHLAMMGALDIVKARLRDEMDSIENE